MTSETGLSSSGSPLVVTGWFRWLTWFFVIAIGAALLSILLMLSVGPDSFERLFGVHVDIPEVTAWWLVNQVSTLFFGVACAGVLLGYREAATFAIILAWSIVGLQLLDAGAKLFQLHLSLPIGAVLYAAFAIKASGVLGAQKRGGGTPPGSRGML